VNVAD